MIRFRPNKEKILNIILWLANERPGMDMYRILKILFIADKNHFNIYGRPIAGEKYVAMKYGPVAETAYGILKRRNEEKRALHLVEFPFTLHADKDGREVCVYPSREPNLASFSKSEVKALENALERYGNLDFNALKALTHGHKAYERAWAERSSKGSVPIRYEDFLEDDKADPELVEDLEYASQFVRG